MITSTHYLNQTRGTLALATIKENKDSDRENLPREKLLRQGAASLSDLELIAVILGRGISSNGIFSLSRQTLDLLDRSNNKVPLLEQLKSIPGLGPAQAARIAAALELGQRSNGFSGITISGPEDLHRMVAHYADRKQETFLAVSLNGAGSPIGCRIVSIGLVNRTQVHPREVFADVITDRACSLIVAHNHPSGNVDPSEEDLLVTRRLVEAGETLGIPLLDHLIFTSSSFASIRELRPELFFLNI